MLLCSRFTGLPILSKERAVRINVANATGGHLDSCQCCRRFQKRTRPDKIRVLNIAQGSLEESQYYRILTRDLHYADTPNLRSQLDEVSQMLDAYNPCHRKHFDCSKEFTLGVGSTAINFLLAPSL
jgi:23S rRNA-intervening sequence protein